jgi:hypothetical protein
MGHQLTFLKKFYDVMVVLSGFLGCVVVSVLSLALYMLLNDADPYNIALELLI